MNTDFRALCAAMSSWWGLLSLPKEARPQDQAMFDELGRQARAALAAEPVGEGPSESDVAELFYRHMGEGSEVGFENAIAEALARWGRPAAPPAQPSNFDPRLIALATSSEQIPPGPYSEDELRKQWNNQADEHNQWESLDLSEQLAWAQARAIAADRNRHPATPPAPEPGEVGELGDRLGWIAAQLGDIGWSDDSAFVARAATLLGQFSLGGWIVPTVEGEVGALAASLRKLQRRAMDEGSNNGDRLNEAVELTRDATLLQQLSAPAPVVVAVSDALIKAECALADIAEGEEASVTTCNTFVWAERRCAEALAAIRPVMKLHKIRTSEWPPQPLPQAGEGES